MASETEGNDTDGHSSASEASSPENKSGVDPYSDSESEKLSDVKRITDQLYDINLAEERFAVVVGPDNELPPKWEHLQHNVFANRQKKLQGEDDIFRCECKSSAACKDDTTCMNRMLNVECTAGHCTSKCTNMRFQKRQYARIEVFKTEGKGWGLRAAEKIPANHFVTEYCGEICDEMEFRYRAGYLYKDDTSFYWMRTSTGEMIDASRKSNHGRFANHSCNPNMIAIKWLVAGEMCVGLFARRTIRVGEELTLDYDFDCYGVEPQPCRCGEANCRGSLGRLKTVEGAERDTDEFFHAYEKSRGHHKPKRLRKVVDAEDEMDYSQDDSDSDSERHASSSASSDEDAESRRASAQVSRSGRKESEGAVGDIPDAFKTYVRHMLETTENEKRIHQLAKLQTCKRPVQHMFIAVGGLRILNTWISECAKALLAELPAQQPSMPLPEHKDKEHDSANSNQLSSFKELLLEVFTLLQELDVSPRTLNKCGAIVKTTEALATCSHADVASLATELCESWGVCTSAERSVLPSVPIKSKPAQRHLASHSRASESSRAYWRPDSMPDEVRYLEYRKLGKLAPLPSAPKRPSHPHGGAAVSNVPALEHVRAASSVASPPAIRRRLSPPPPPSNAQLHTAAPLPPPVLAGASTGQGWVADAGLRATSGQVGGQQVQGLAKLVSQLSSHVQQGLAQPAAVQSLLSAIFHNTPSTATSSAHPHLHPPLPTPLASAPAPRTASLPDPASSSGAACSGATSTAGSSSKADRSNVKNRQRLLALCQKFGVRYHTLSKFRSDISAVVVRHVAHFHNKGRIASKDDFKHVCRKLTHIIIEKEVRRGPKLGDLKMRPSIERNVKLFIYNFFDQLKDGQYNRKSANLSTT